MGLTTSNRSLAFACFLFHLTPKDIGAKAIRINCEGIGELSDVITHFIIVTLPERFFMYGLPLPCICPWLHCLVSSISLRLCFTDLSNPLFRRTPIRQVFFSLLGPQLLSVDVSRTNHSVFTERTVRSLHPTHFQSNGPKFFLPFIAFGNCLLSFISPT